MTTNSQYTLQLFNGLLNLYDQEQLKYEISLTDSISKTSLTNSFQHFKTKSLFN